MKRGIISLHLATIGVSFLEGANGREVGVWQPQACPDIMKQLTITHSNWSFFNLWIAVPSIRGVCVRRYDDEGRRTMTTTMMMTIKNIHNLDGYEKQGGKPCF